VNPNHCASGVVDSTTLKATIGVVIVRPRLGRLRRRLPIERMTKRTIVCVANDSTNRPV
jgi:hypothetical protein